MRANEMIVVGVDASPGAARALTWAIREARVRSWALHLVHGLPDPGPGGDDADAANRVAAESLLTSASVRAIEAGVREVTRTVSARPAGPLLIELSAEAALLVVGARESGARILRRGESVGVHLSRHARCPLVVVGRPWNSATGRIAVYVRGTPADRSALAFAFDHAAATHSEIEVVHAWREPEPGPLDFSALVDDRVEAHRRASEVMIGEQVAGFATSYPDVPVLRVSLPADPRDALLWSSAQADLLVLAAPDPESERTSADLVELTTLRHSHCPVVFTR